MEPVRITYPLPCGCAGAKYVSMCARHQAEERDAHSVRLGVRETEAAC